MKECPKCHHQYDDSMNFCTKDGCQLVDVNPNNANNNGSNHKKKEKKDGCLKNIIVTIVILIVAMRGLYSCIMNAATYLRTEPNQYVSAKAGGECKVDIDYDGYMWFITHKPEWVDIDENDYYFNLIVNPNQTGQTREGSITIKSGKQLAQVSIKQSGLATQIKASKNSLKFPSSGGKKTIIIETDGCGWEEAQGPEWISVRNVMNGVAISCHKNSGEYRTGNVIFKEDYVSSTVYITQGGLCNNCHGEGEITCSGCSGMGGIGFGLYFSQCTWCGGSGNRKCSMCNGSGERE